MTGIGTGGLRPRDSGERPTAPGPGGAELPGFLPRFPGVRIDFLVILLGLGAIVLQLPSKVRRPEPEVI